MVERHKPPRRVDERIDDGQLELVPFGDRGPVVHAGTAQRVRADPHALLADHVDVDDVRQVGHVAVHVVVTLSGLQRPRQRHALHLDATATQNLVGALGDCVRRVGVGGTAIGRVVLEAAVIGRVVRRCHDDSVGQRFGATPVVGEDGVAHGRRRRVPVGRINRGYYLIGGQHLQRRHPCRFRKPVCVTANEQRPGGAVRAAILDDRLGDREDVGLVERCVERRTAMARRAERHLLGDVVGIGFQRVVGRYQMGQIDEVFGQGRLAGARVGHVYRFCPCSTLMSLYAAKRSPAGKDLHSGKPRLPRVGRDLCRWSAGRRRPRGAGHRHGCRSGALAMADVHRQHRRRLLGRLLHHPTVGAVAVVELPAPAARHGVLRRVDHLLDDAGRNGADDRTRPLGAGRQLHRRQHRQWGCWWCTWPRPWCAG